MWTFLSPFRRSPGGAKDEALWATRASWTLTICETTTIAENPTTAEAEKRTTEIPRGRRMLEAGWALQSEEKQGSSVTTSRTTEMIARMCEDAHDRGSKKIDDALGLDIPTMAKPGRTLIEIVLMTERGIATKKDLQGPGICRKEFVLGQGTEQKEGVLDLEIKQIGDDLGQGSQTKEGVLGQEIKSKEGVLGPEIAMTASGSTRPKTEGATKMEVLHIKKQSGTIRDPQNEGMYSKRVKCLPIPKLTH